MMRRGLGRALVAALLLAATLLVTGESPTYSECRPYIDATIRDLAAKAIVSGEVPSKSLRLKDYGLTAESAEPPPKEPLPGEHDKPPAGPAGQPDVPAGPPAAPEVKVEPQEEVTAASAEEPPCAPVEEGPAVPAGPPAPAKEEPAAPVEVKPPAPGKKEPVSPVEEEPAPPAEEEPAPPVEEEPAPPVEEEPAPPVVEEPAAPVEEEPPIEEEPAVPVEEEHATPEEEPAPPGVEEPAAPIVEEPAAPVEEPAPPGEEPAPPAVEEPAAPVEPAPPGEEPAPPAVEEPAAPVVEEPAPPAVEEPAPPVVEKTAAPVEEEPAAPVEIPKPKEAPKAKEGDRILNIFDKFVDLVFGLPKVKREAKWAQPWQTHKEFKKKPVEEPAAKPVAKVVKSEDGIFHKFITFIFGEPAAKREEKWAQPWQTHKEHKKEPQKQEPQKQEPAPKEKVDTSGGIVDKFVSMIFGKPEGKREDKWAEPWQTHKEHQKKAKEEVVQEKKVPVATSGGILDSFVKLIFTTTEDNVKRDPKWSKPWQTHPEFSKKSEKVEKVEKPKEKEKVGTTGGMLDSLVHLIFTTQPEGAERDPKWAEPWQKHPEHDKKTEKVEEPVKKKEVVEKKGGGLIDSFVRLVFTTLPEDSKRDPKWAQPWQTHKEHAKKPVKVEEPKEKTKVVVEEKGGGLLDSFVKLLFTTLPEESKRDPKWAQPWQTHKEHAKKEAKAEEPVKKKVVVEEKGGGLIDSLVKLLFTTLPEGSKRDPKWAQPWQTHKEHAKGKAPAPAPEPKVVVPEPKPAAAPAPTPEPEVVTEPEPAEALAPEPEPEVAAPAPEPITEPEPEVAPAPEPKAKPTPTPEPAPVSEPEPEPVVEEPTVVEATFRGEEAEDTDEAPAAAPADAQPVADAPEASDQQVLVEEAPAQQVPAPAKPKEEEEEQILVVPTAVRSRDRLEAILGLDESSQDAASRTDPVAEATLKELKNIHEHTIKPMEVLYKYHDISNRHVSDAELFGKPLILLVGPYSTGKSTFINYLLGVEYTKRALKTGTPPSHGVFRVVQYGDSDGELTGTDLSAHWSFASLQKFGQNFVDQLHGKALNCPLLKKVTFVEAPGILEMRRPGERLYPFNDVVQWVIDRADLILVMFDYTKLDAGYELEAILDQLKGREAQTRILLNKADQVPAEELIKVQGSLFWNLSPLLGVSSPPTVYAGSFASRPYRTGSPAKLFQAQEEALLRDVARAVNARVDNRIAIGRRHAVRVRNHAQMVDTYLTTYYKNKGFLTSKHKLAEDIVENPHVYNIYEGMSLLTNISRYDLPDPEIYRDFFRVHNLFDFPTLRQTCSFFRGCPITKIDAAISNDLPELLERHRRLLEAAVAAPGPKSKGAAPVPAPAVRGSVPAAATVHTS